MSLVASTSDRTLIRRELEIREYRSSRDRQWYWRITNRKNGEIEGASSQGYSHRDDCRKNLWRVSGFEPDVSVDEGCA